MRQNTQNSFSVRARPSGFQKQTGFTLIEIMVGLVLGLLVLSAVVQVFISTQQSARIQQSSSRMQEDGRLAMDILDQYIRTAGYTTHPWDGPTSNKEKWKPALNERGFPPDPAGTIAGGGSAWTLAGQVIRGGEDDVNGIDSIRIRYQGSGDNAISTCLGTPATINQMVDVTFSLTAPDTDLNGARSLQCTDNSTNTTQPLIGGLEDMQIWYGLSQEAFSGGLDEAGRLNGVTAYVSASNVPANQWNRVIAIRIQFVVRSENDNLTLETQNYTFNGSTITPSDKRIRYVMDTAANLRNKVP